jgi:hypothetical protein
MILALLTALACTPKDLRPAALVGVQETPLSMCGDALRSRLAYECGGSSFVPLGNGTGGGAVTPAGPGDDPVCSVVFAVVPQPFGLPRYANGLICEDGALKVYVFGEAS